MVISVNIVYGNLEIAKSNSILKCGVYAFCLIDPFGIGERSDERRNYVPAYVKHLVSLNS